MLIGSTICQLSVRLFYGIEQEGKLVICALPNSGQCIIHVLYIETLRNGKLSHPPMKGTALLSDLLMRMLI